MVVSKRTIPLSGACGVVGVSEGTPSIILNLPSLSMKIKSFLPKKNEKSASRFVPINGSSVIDAVAPANVPLSSTRGLKSKQSLNSKEVPLSFEMNVGMFS